MLNLILTIHSFLRQFYCRTGVIVPLRNACGNMIRYVIANMVKPVLAALHDSGNLIGIFASECGKKCWKADTAPGVSRE